MYQYIKYEVGFDAVYVIIDVHTRSQKEHPGPLYDISENPQDANKVHYFFNLPLRYNNFKHLCSTKNTAVKNTFVQMTV